MDCKFVASKLVQYLDEDLPAAIYREITEHLDRCYLCVEEYHELVRVTDLARQTLRCPVYCDGYDRLRKQLRQIETSDIFYFPRRLRVLRTALTGAAITAAAVLFAVSVGLPAIEAIHALDAVMDAQAAGEGPVADPTQARGHSLIAWSSGIRWAEKLSFESKVGPQPPDEEQSSGEEPMTRGLPATPPGVVLSPFCGSRMIVLA
jgi:anti-sigma factor RsiW